MAKQHLTSTPYGERIRFLAGEESLHAFAATVRIPYTTLRSIVIYGKTPGADILTKIAEATGVSGHWLLTGEKPIYWDGKAPESADTVSRQVVELREKLTKLAEGLAEAEQQLGQICAARTQVAR